MVVVRVQARVYLCPHTAVLNGKNGLSRAFEKGASARAEDPGTRAWKGSEGFFLFSSPRIAVLIESGLEQCNFAL